MIDYARCRGKRCQQGPTSRFGSWGDLRVTLIHELGASRAARPPHPSSLPSPFTHAKLAVVHTLSIACKRRITVSRHDSCYIRRDGVEDSPSRLSVERRRGGAAQLAAVLGATDISTTTANFPWKSYFGLTGDATPRFRYGAAAADSRSSTQTANFRTNRASLAVKLVKVMRVEESLSHQRRTR